MVRLHRRRRRFGVAIVALLVAAGALAACGDDGDDDGTEASSRGSESGREEAAGTRTVETERGRVEIPASPERVLALDEYAALNLLAVGVEPAVVWGSYQSEVGGRVLEGAGIEVEPGAVDGVNFEAVAAAEPDLIVFTSEAAFMSNYEQLSEIAPTVVLPYAEPWRDVITTTAAVFDRTAEAGRLIEALEGRIEELRGAVDRGSQSISILADTQGMLFAASMRAPLSQLVDEVGFTRPRAQAEGTPDQAYESAVMISTEVLDEHDADLVVVLSGAYYNADTLLSAPTFQALPAVVDGGSFVADGDMWFGTYPFAIFWVLEDLDALQRREGEDALGTVEDTEDRWAAFEELVG